MSLIESKNQRRPFTNGGLARRWGLEDLFDDDFFSTKLRLPAMNVKEHEDDFEIEFAIPGFSKNDFEIDLEDDLLYITAEKSDEDIEDEDNYTRREFNYSSFSRTLQLPHSVDMKRDIMASYEKGILKIKLFKQKASQNQPRKRIDIK